MLLVVGLTFQAACLSAGSFDPAAEDAGADASPGDGSVGSDGSISPGPDGGVPSDGGNPEDGGGPGPEDDGGGTDAGSVDSCATRVLCEDFEGHTVGMAPGAPWTVSLSPNTSRVVIDSARAYRGANSVRTSAAGGFFTKAFLQLSGPTISNFAGNVMYGRAMVWRASNAKGAHTTMIQASGPLASPHSGSGYYKFGHGSTDKFMVNYAGPSSTCNDCSVISATSHPADTWICLEWMFDGTNSVQRYWLDGQELTDTHTTLNGSPSNPTQNPWPAPRFETLDLGWETYILDVGAADLWYDDVAIDDERIGCPT